MAAVILALGALLVAFCAGVVVGSRVDYDSKAEFWRDLESGKEGE